MKTVAILDKILLTILLFSYSRLYIVFIQIYEIGHIYVKNQDIWAHMMWFINLHVLILL